MNPFSHLEKSSGYSLKDSLEGSYGKSYTGERSEKAFI